mmetsp:Transcript_21491/g.63432  ORF Transcript_21491/g.63432 Transcript_21491/m.63432 type:complete len:323 (+) Transcript_21491:33-1001(+)
MVPQRAALGMGRGAYFPRAFSRPDVAMVPQRAALGMGRGALGGSVHSAAMYRPRRIVLIRHGQSAGNIDEEAYTTTPDWRIPLTAHGRAEAQGAGRKLRALLEERSGARAYFYHSPYLRCQDTLDAIISQLNPECIIGTREEPRISEQQFGNLQSTAVTQKSKAERNHFGRFYYRFPSGESALDVYNRVSSFIATIYRDVEQMRGVGVLTPETHIVIVSHGLAARAFIMRWFQLTVGDFELLSNQPNGSLLVMELHTDAMGNQWYELTHDSWKLLNADGCIDLKCIRVGGKPGEMRHLVRPQNVLPSVCGLAPPSPPTELDG